MSQSKTITFRDLLRGAMSQFLEGSDIDCKKTEIAICEVIGELVSYREEGVDVFPEICFCHDILKLLGRIGGAEHIELGRGPLGSVSARKALKSCAPISAAGATVYIERNKASKEYAFGVYFPGSSPFSSSSRILREQQKDDSPLIVLAKRASRQSVTLLNASGQSRIVHFSNERDDGPAPDAALDGLIAAITRKVPDDIREKTIAFLNSILDPILTRSHGTLVGVVAADATVLPASCTDAQLLSPTLDIGERINSFDGSASAQSRLMTVQRFFEGIIQSDGAIVAREDATVLAYRVFFPKIDSTGASISGGARRRAYASMKAMVTKGDLVAAFMRSHDGETEFSGK